MLGPTHLALAYFHEDALLGVSVIGLVQKQDVGALAKILQTTKLLWEQWMEITDV